MMYAISSRVKELIASSLIACLFNSNAFAQTNLLLNGDFEDINICTEYNAECGVEGWFYLKDVKAQMISNEPGNHTLGNNTFGLYFNWNGYTGFSPLIGTLLPCGLQKDKRYIFKGKLSVKLNPRLILTPGMAIGGKFYVPKRPFSAKLVPDSIVNIIPVRNSIFYEFEYSFVATGSEKYLTFGTYIIQDTTGGKKNLVGTQTVSVMIDNFQLLADDASETTCIAMELNKQTIYNYNFRHKEMDHSLFGKGEINIRFDDNNDDFVTRTGISMPKTQIKADTLKLGDVFFDFNKANLKSEALKMLDQFFKSGAQNNIDSIYIEGHTDSIGSDSRNLALSRQRCESVQYWLQQNQVLAADQIQIHPFGKTRPVASNSTSQGRALNRRVEVVIFRRSE